MVVGPAGQPPEEAPLEQPPCPPAAHPRRRPARRPPPCRWPSAGRLHHLAGEEPGQLLVPPRRTAPTRRGWRPPPGGRRRPASPRRGPRTPCRGRWPRGRRHRRPTGRPAPPWTWVAESLPPASMAEQGGEGRRRRGARPASTSAATSLAARARASAAGAPRSAAADHQVVETLVDHGQHLVGLGRGRRPPSSSTSGPAGSAGSGPMDAGHPGLPRGVGARAAPGRARGSSGSRRPLPSSAWSRSARPPRPSAGSPGRPTPPASRSATCRAASYSMARASERSELRFLISQRVPNAGRRPGGPRRWRRPACEPSSMRPSEAPVATSTARSSAA